MNMIESTRKVHNDLIEFLEKLTPERHQEFIDLCFPKYMVVEGKDFVFNGKVTKSFYTSHTGDVLSNYSWIDFVKQPQLFAELNGDTMKTLGAGMVLLGCVEYINTLSSSDVGKIKKLVDASGTIYPLLELFIDESQYIESLLSQQSYSSGSYNPGMAPDIVLYIRENPIKEINYNWFHFDIKYSGWVGAYRHYLHLSIVSLCDKTVSTISDNDTIAIYNITKEHCLSKMNPDEKALMTTITTMCDSHIPFSPPMQILMGLPNELQARYRRITR